MSTSSEDIVAPIKETGNTAVIISPKVEPDGYTLAQYADDDAFNNGTDPYTERVVLILNSTDGWDQSFPEQEKYDEYGRPYIYYVEETGFTGEGYVTGSITGNPNNGETVIVTNVKDQEPVSPLPATGGPGTMLMYGLGAVVAEITGYNILSKRRKKYRNSQRYKIMKKRWS